jgi:hypothetical protein
LIAGRVANRLPPSEADEEGLRYEAGCPSRVEFMFEGAFLGGVPRIDPGPVKAGQTENLAPVVERK